MPSRTATVRIRIPFRRNVWSMVWSLHDVMEARLNANF